MFATQSQFLVLDNSSATRNAPNLSSTSYVPTPSQWLLSVDFCMMSADHTNSVSSMVQSLIPPDVGKSKMKKRVGSGSHREVTVMSAVSMTELKLLLMMLWLPTALKLFSLPALLLSVVTDAKERFARSLQIQCLKILMTFS